MPYKIALCCTLLLLFSSTMWSQNPIRKGKDYAIFFYVTDFDDKGWGRLPETRREVTALSAELENNYGFKTEIVANPSKKMVLDKIRTVNARVYGPNDQVLFFFSTHGFFSSADDRGYLIPRDGKSKDEYGESWISYDDLGSYITRNPSEHVLVALDACYSGAFGDRYKGRPTVDASTSSGTCAEQVTNALEYDSRLYFTSGGRDQRTPAKSLFADRWLGALREGASKGIVRKNDLRYQLSTIEAPRPEGGSFTSKHKAGGDFVFVHNNACRPQQDRQALDQNHWRSLGKTPSRTALEQHLKEYPACPHFQKAIDLLTAINSRKTIPDDMVFVQGGTFEMGDTFGDGEEDEKPTHKVTLSSYYLGRYEVTVAEFSEFILATNYKTDAEKDGGSYFWENDKWEKKAGIDWRYDAAGKKRPNSEYNHPVIHVSWNDAVAYCNWRSKQEGLRPVYTINANEVTPSWSANGYRLPTEAEWEYAARSRGKKYKYSWGSGSPSGNIADEKAKEEFSAWTIWEDYNDGYVYTSPVGAFKANDLGLFDMTGNALEWCWDWYGDYSNSTQTNPRGPSTAQYRVLRGGSWRSLPANLHCAYRISDTPGYRRSYIGFRLSRAAP